MASRSSKPVALFLAACEVAVLSVVESRSPQRRLAEPRTKHVIRNLAIAATGASIITAIEVPIARGLGDLAVRRRWGLTQMFVPAPLRGIVGLFALDYSFYIWHVLTHRVPFLWRFHQVHHADRDLDTSTAVRFHFGELALSVPWRALQVFLIGVSPRTYDVWRLFVFISIAFHHSNIALPPAWDDRIGKYITTPRMHGIHHANMQSQSNSNYSSGLSLWDKLHHTFATQVTMNPVGLPAFPQAQDVTLAKMFLLPFRRHSDSWLSRG